MPGGGGGCVNVRGLMILGPLSSLGPRPNPIRGIWSKGVPGMAPVVWNEGGTNPGGNMGGAPGFINGGIPTGWLPGMKLMGIGLLNIGPGPPKPNPLDMGGGCCCAAGLIWLGSKM